MQGNWMIRKEDLQGGDTTMLMQQVREVMMVN